MILATFNVNMYGKYAYYCNEPTRAFAKTFYNYEARHVNSPSPSAITGGRFEHVPLITFWSAVGYDTKGSSAVTLAA